MTSNLLVLHSLVSLFLWNFFGNSSCSNLFQTFCFFCLLFHYFLIWRYICMSTLVGGELLFCLGRSLYFEGEAVVLSGGGYCSLSRGCCSFWGCCYIFRGRFSVFLYSFPIKHHVSFLSISEALWLPSFHANMY